MVIWLNVPRSPSFKGKVMKSVVQSLENTGSSFWEMRQTTHILNITKHFPNFMISFSNYLTTPQVICNNCVGILNEKDKKENGIHC